MIHPPFGIPLSGWTTRLTVLVLLAIWLPLQAQEPTPKLWVGLIQASAKGPDSTQLEALAPRLRSVFGYPHYHLAYETEVPLNKPWDQWVLPSKAFYMKIIPLGIDEKSGMQGIHFELYQGDKPLIQAKYKMNTERPLFIRGPQYGDGELIFVLKMLPPASEKP